MVFRRPELEKDNPTAPQPYVGPRRRQSQARGASAKDSTRAEQIRERLQILAKAAASFVNSRPKTKKKDEGLNVLRDAIIQAERVLSVKRRSLTSRTDL
jgi:hypothetical protein